MTYKMRLREAAREMARKRDAATTYEEEKYCAWALDSMVQDCIWADIDYRKAAKRRLKRMRANTS